MSRIVVIGAGLIGLACAYTLRKAGADVLTLDEGEPCFGSSLGNAGWIVPSLAGPMLAPGSRAPATTVFRPGIDCSFRLDHLSEGVADKSMWL